MYLRRLVGALSLVDICIFQIITINAVCSLVLICLTHVLQVTKCLAVVVFRSVPEAFDSRELWKKGYNVSDVGSFNVTETAVF